MRFDGVLNTSISTVEKATIHQVVIHPIKIDMTKFNDKGNLGMWRCEVMDVLCSLNLEEILESDDRPEQMLERDWLKMNRSACGLIRNCLSQEIKYGMMIETFIVKLWKTLENKYLMKSVENHLHMKRQLYRL